MTEQQPVLFVDVDGVLRIKRPYDGKLDPLCVSHLNAISRKTDARIVITSTWRWSWSIAQFNELLDGRVIGITPDVPPAYAGEYSRFSEIRAWLGLHPEIKRWLAIDDDVEGFHPHCQHVHLTDPSIGLTSDDVQKIFVLLKHR